MGIHPAFMQPQAVRVGILSLGIIALLGSKRLCYEDYQVHCPIFSSTSGLFPQHASCTSPILSYDKQKCLPTLPCDSGWIATADYHCFKSVIHGYQIGWNNVLIFHDILPCATWTWLFVRLFALLSICSLSDALDLTFQTSACLWFHLYLGFNELWTNLDQYLLTWASDLPFLLQSQKTKMQSSFSRAQYCPLRPQPWDPNSLCHNPLPRTRTLTRAYWNTDLQVSKKKGQSYFLLVPGSNKIVFPFLYVLLKRQSSEAAPSILWAEALESAKGLSSPVLSGPRPSPYLAFLFMHWLCPSSESQG
jgi:hypothetical protein